jgi:hypothetical protein
VRRSAAVLAAVAALAALAAAPARGALPRDFFGAVANGPLDDPAFDLSAESSVMAGAGVRTERLEIAWDLVEPRPGAFDFAAVDRKVLAAAAHGLDVLAVVIRCPAWAARHPGVPFSVPRHDGDYAAFLRVLVGRYGPRGSLWSEHPELAARPVRAWEIWNEPNLPAYFSERSFARPYARLLDAAYAALKRADPGSTVVMAGMANFSWRDLDRLFAAGIPLRFDVAAVHPFSGRPSNSLKIVRLNRQVLDRHGARRKPMWLTELTWSSAKGRTKNTPGWETTPAGQAARLREAYRLFIAARRSLRLQRIYWYTWASIDQGPNSFSYSGLRLARSDGTFADKPALAAFRAVVRRYG